MGKIPDAVRKAAVEWSSHLFIRDRVKLAQDMLEATEEYRNDYAEQQAIAFVEWIDKNATRSMEKGKWIYYATNADYNAIHTTSELYTLYKQTIKP